MKGQVQIIASIAAIGLLVAVASILYLNLLSGVSSYRVMEVGSNVYSVIGSKMTWSACELAYALKNSTGVSYVFVNVTVIDLQTGRTLSVDYCELRSSQSSSYYRVYTYMRETRDGLVYFYVVRVAP
ncbi:hypothetical protein TCELL_1221 [Thermogladius calderae 1633]|uniref:Uncharacterized protein n=1 Tax=Thermogladius calderae (strain DSM 22663 / VKM B-2946 / 1633) TaxID=1184251 RepID=I3TFV6_THEC1|nr:hypothetical protein [Thermogladius calderae]AFK51644.1 hypothetical protein TCELL_1221 [Thermogladius calderae 1633]